MIKILTPARGSVEPKNIWLCDEYGLKFNIDWVWNFAENGTKHVHTFADCHEDIAALFAMRWA